MPTSYRQRRANLISVFENSGGGILLAPSRHARSHGETFRQLNDFLYFTGLEFPDSVLAMDADKGNDDPLRAARRSALRRRLAPERFSGLASIGGPRGLPVCLGSPRSGLTETSRGS